MIQGSSPDVITSMGWKGCALLIASAGAVGGLLNAYLTDHGLRRPTIMNGVWCPGAIGNVTVGAVTAFISWALYGSGAGVEVAASNASARELISLRLSALAGALLVGVAGARWLSSEVDKALLSEGVRRVAQKPLSSEQTEELKHCDTSRKILKAIART